MSAAWRVVPDEEAARTWDQRLQAFPDANLSQTFFWSRHKEAAGLYCLRLVAEEAGQPLAAVQALVRRGPLGWPVLWVAGGPLGDASLWGDDLRVALLSAAGSRRAIIRIRPYRHYDPELAFSLSAGGWSRALRPLDSSWTILVSFDGDEAAARQQLTPNWRHNLRRAESRNTRLRAWDKPDEREVAALLREVHLYKDIPPQYQYFYEERELRSLFEHLGRSLVLWRADDESGRMIALRGCVVLGRRAYDLMAGSTEEGRRRYSAYALLWRLLAEARARGAEEFDLGGVSPRELGVYNFKRGVGGRLVEHVGEWEWAASRHVLLAANAYITLRGRR